MSIFQTARDELRARGVVLRHGPGEYRLNYADSTEVEYITDDLEDALRRGRDMAACKPQPALPPLGPIGCAVPSRRGLMYRHNRMIAARRRRKMKQ